MWRLAAWCPRFFVLVVVALTSPTVFADGYVTLQGLRNTAAFYGLALNPVTNKVYGFGFEIDGKTNAVRTFSGFVGCFDTSPFICLSELLDRAVGVNIFTNKVYAAEYRTNTVYVTDPVTSSTTTVAVGHGPVALAVNPLTNRIYVANTLDNSVSVIDGNSGNTTTVTTGPSPRSVALNLATNKIYVTNSGANTVTVIDGLSNSTSTITVGAAPLGIAVNPVTNKIYVANSGNTTVTVIDGATKATTTIPTSGTNRFVAINAVTNQIYVTGASFTVIDGGTNAVTTLGGGSSYIEVDAASNTIYVVRGGLEFIDGATNLTKRTNSSGVTGPFALNPLTGRLYSLQNNYPYTNSVFVQDAAPNVQTTIPVGTTPVAVAFNPRNGDAYILNQGSSNVTILDAAWALRRTVSTGGQPSSVAFNVATNQAYVTNSASGTVTGIDGSSGATMTYSVGTAPVAIAVNPVTNKAFVVNKSSNDATVIDLATGNTSRVACGTSPVAVAVNETTNKAYVVNSGSNNVTVVDGNTLATTTVAVGRGPTAIVVNALANRIYVANSIDFSVTLIFGSNNTTTALGSMGANGTLAPTNMAIMPALNKLFVTFTTAGGIAIIDTVSNAWSFSTTTYPSPPNVAFERTMFGDALTNKTYVVDHTANSWDTLEVMDSPSSPGISFEKIDNLTSGFNSGAFDAFSNRIAIANSTTNTVLGVNAWSGAGAAATVQIQPLPGNVASVSPSFVFQVTGCQSCANGEQLVYYQLDGWSDKWLLANRDGSSFSITLPTLSVGTHTLYASVLDLSAAAGTGQQSIASFSKPTAYSFVVIPGAPTSTPARLVNISTRGQVLTGNDVMIGGFVVGGPTSKTVAVRAIGPSLANYGVANSLANPTLTLMTVDGNVVASNDNWDTDANAELLSSAGVAPSNALESAIYTSLPPGAYGAVVSGVNGGTGVGLVEVYEIDHPEVPLINISTRGKVGTGSDVLIGGFVVNGASSQTVIVRGIGPSLANYGITSPLSNPVLQVVRMSDHAVLATSDDWQSSQSAWHVVAAGLAPLNPAESAIYITLPPGAYGAILSGVNGTTGTALVEIYTVQ